MSRSSLCTLAWKKLKLTPRDAAASCLVSAILGTGAMREGFIRSPPTGASGVVGMPAHAVSYAVGNVPLAPPRGELAVLVKQVVAATTQHR